MKRFILSIILLIVIIGAGQLLMILAPVEQQPESQAQLPTPVEHINSQPDTITTDITTTTPTDSLPTDTTSIVTAN